LVGKALARVAAHEIAHFQFQEHGHHSQGLLRDSFPAWQLADEDSLPFHLAMVARR
jgi:hypothetical protein